MIDQVPALVLLLLDLVFWLSTPMRIALRTRRPRARPRRSSPRGSAAAEPVDEARAGCSPYPAPGYIDLGISELLGGRGDFGGDAEKRLF